MKAITVYQPHASLIVAGVKTIETKPSPPNGPMRPDEVRGLPGLRIEPGERIAIHAAAVAPTEDAVFGPWEVHEYADNRWRVSLTERPTRRIVLPLGAIVGTVVVADALRIVEEDDPIPLPCIEPGERHLSLWYPASGAPGDEATEHYVTDQLPLGDFTPGRWGWLLTDPKPTTELCICCLNDRRSGAVCMLCNDQHGTDPVPVRGHRGVWSWEP